MQPTDEEILAQAQRYFRCFLVLVWHQLGLPLPSRVQIEMADFLQFGPEGLIVHAMRGEGKSWITAAYVLWMLWKDPRLNILVVSASGSKAFEFSAFCKKLIQEMPLLQHLKPRPDQRDAVQAWDVNGAGISQAPSVKSVGITGQITGSRADVIIADDIETITNSCTVEQREKLLYLVTEFVSVLKPKGRVRFLGTPQSVETIYRVLAKRGYLPRYWPSRVPSEKEREAYGDYLAPDIIRMIDAGVSIGTPTDPDRFDDEALRDKELRMGKSNYMLQFQLNTSLSDLERYPLRLSDLIVMPLHAVMAPVRLQHAAIAECALKTIPSVGFGGDRWYGPFYRDPAFADYQGTVMAVDPSGRGKDETSYAIVKQLHGNLFLLDAGGFPGGYESATLIALANKAKQYNVNKTVIEANFGDGMFTQLLKPVMAEIHRCECEEVRHSRQKELRIIDVLEPVMNAHRLIVDQSLVEREMTQASSCENDGQLMKNLFYQLTHITRERGSLKHDDRLDALAIAVGYWTEAMAQDADRRADELADATIQQELDRFVDHIRTGKAFSLAQAPGQTRFF